MSQTKPKAVIVDVDGTLCDVKPIRYILQGRQKYKFKKFHEMSLTCGPIEMTLDYIEEARRQDLEILIVTARPYEFEELTKTWLEYNLVIPRRQSWDTNFEYHGPFMRGDQDFDPDVVIKNTILMQLFEKYDIVGAIDDNPAIIKLWQDWGIPTTVVPGWHNHVPMKELVEEEKK